MTMRDAQHRADFVDMERWASARVLISMQTKKTPEQIHPLWVDDFGRKKRMEMLDTLKEKHKDLIARYGRK